MPVSLTTNRYTWEEPEYKILVYLSIQFQYI